VDLELGDAVVVVTGATDGLGAALAARLVGEGARVAFCARTVDRVEDAAGRLRSAGGDVLGIVADVTSSVDIDRLVAETVSRWGRIDGIVNNAGQHAGDEFENVSDEAWIADIDLKVMAAVRLIRGALPHMRRAGGGSIVNVVNTLARAPIARSLPTSATRAAGLAITKALSKELGPDNIRVNGVLVGIIESGQWRRRAEKAGISLDEFLRNLASDIPMGRVGTGDDFADLVTFLLSKRSSFITGTAINLDGGASPVA
jgi:NAD(P)-dependent dehydrogenase (short-subunit alcohol dehydrogenase family)